MDDIEKTDEEDYPTREALTLNEYLNSAKDYLLDCFDENLLLKKQSVIERNLREALDVIDEMEQARWEIVEEEGI